MSETIDLLEHTPITRARAIDEDKGILYGLAALGPNSAWGYDYPEDTMREALPLLEGRQSFVNHLKNKSDEPSVYDLLGVWRNLRVEGGRTLGDFHYFKSHSLAPSLVEAARRPELNAALGFSINARGKQATRNGRRVVESIQKVYSIDCVAQPATLNGLYESTGGRAVKKPIKDLIESLSSARPGYSKALREMAEAGVVSPDAAMDEPPATAAADEGADHEQAILDACKACLDDSSLDVPGKLKKIKQLLGVMKGKGGGKPGDGADAGETEESKKRKADANLVEQVARLTAEKTVRKAAGVAGVSLSETLVEALARPGMTDEQAKAVVAELKGSGQGGTSQRPRSAAPIIPPQGGTGAVKSGVGSTEVRESKVPEDGKAVGSWLNGR